MAVSAYADTSAINEFRMTIYPKSDGCARPAARHGVLNEAAGLRVSILGRTSDDDARAGR